MSPCQIKLIGFHVSSDGNSVKVNLIFLPDEENISFTHVLVSHGATEILLPMFNVSFLVKYLDEVEVAVVGFLETVLWELDVDLLPLLGSDDPGAVEGRAPLLGVGHLLLGDVCCSWETKQIRRRPRAQSFPCREQKMSRLGWLLF